ncbi:MULTISPECIES: thioesterase family protein [unclassified Saccharopolyspora]|uniref:acyl-CoA thioesterase n=1 Tax=unclassified Saccharopolyspora TaxID=2646250 RepID=UPI001CD705FD|nr:MULTISPECIES: thioesterase family protein [unclassified Saccharopolyspora]MCA1195083.1 acyl-CoA thioesterase [Saccharopolyspora sp. 6V]MCA1224625.1 acyl-CoA thioesterase [Saccharopolyspora sp. 6M]
MAEPAEGLPRRGDFTVLWPITTRWADNDVYGHVNNVVHYSWFDTAVNGWLIRATGADIRDFPEIGLVVETNCRYLAELGFPEDVEVGVGLERVGNTSVVYRLAVFGGGAEGPASVGRFVHVYVDRETRRPVRVPERIRTALAGLRSLGS